MALNTADSSTAATSNDPVWPVGMLAFTLLYMTAAVVGAILTANVEFVFYIAVMVVLIGAMAAVHQRVGFSGAVLWGLSFWGLAHMAGGLVPVPQSWPINGEIRVLYSWWIVPGWIKYDHVVHAYGFGVTTWVCWQGLKAALRPHTLGAPLRPSPGMLLLCAAAANGFGALNELVEFVATLLVPRTNVGGYVNTGWDLVANGVGSAVAAVLIGLGERSGSR